MVHDFSVLCTAAQKVFEFAYSQEKERWKKMCPLLKKAHGLGVIRNSVAHGLWVPSIEGGKVIHVSRSLKPNISVKQADALEKKADEARAVRVGIATIADEDLNVKIRTRGREWK